MKMLTHLRQGYGGQALTALPSPARGRGFTLVEMAVVLAVLILLAAIIVPTVGPMLRQGKMREATSKVAGALREARSTAVASSSNVTVQFPGGKRVQFKSVTTYEPPAMPRPTGAVWNAGRAVYEVESLTVTDLPDGIEIATPLPSDVIFYPDGSSSGVALTVQEAGKMPKKNTVVVSMASGRVSVQTR